MKPVTWKEAIKAWTDKKNIYTMVNGKSYVCKAHDPWSVVEVSEELKYNNWYIGNPDD